MHYLKVVCDMGAKKEIEKHYDLRYGAPGLPRQKRRKKTPDEMAAQNRWRRKRELRRLIEMNFGEGDWHVILTCRPQDRPEKGEAPQRIRAFRDKLRTAYKKRGWCLKYIITCEVGQRGATHWHMIVNDQHDGEQSTAQLIRRLWPWGRPYFSPMDDSGEYERLAEYIVKQTGTRISREETVEKLSYMRSRNLIRPVVRTEKVRSRSWKREPKAPPGWQIVPGSLVNGQNKYNGYPYQYYTIKKIRNGDRNEKGGNLYRDGPERPCKRCRQSDVHNADGQGKRQPL